MFTDRKVPSQMYNVIYSEIEQLSFSLILVDSGESQVESINWSSKQCTFLDNHHHNCILKIWKISFEYLILSGSSSLRVRSSLSNIFYEISRKLLIISLKKIIKIMRLYIKIYKINPSIAALAIKKNNSATSLECQTSAVSDVLPSLLIIPVTPLIQTTPRVCVCLCMQMNPTL